MSEREAFDRILASLHEAALDRERWSTAAGLIDEALRTHGSSMTFGGGTPTRTPGSTLRGASCVENGTGSWSALTSGSTSATTNGSRACSICPTANCIPDNTQLYTEQEMKTSATYNELLIPHHAANAVTVRLDGPNGTRIAWAINDPLDGDGWSTAQLDSIRRLLPHIRQTVRVQQALDGAGALGASLANLLDTTGLGIVQLDGHGQILAANDRALGVLRRGDGLFDEHGFLHARSPEDDAELQKLLGRALPPFGAQGAGASTTLRRASGPRLVLHVSPVGRREADARTWPVAALVLVIDPASQTRINPAVAAAALGLTPAESRVAVLLADGKTVREVAEAAGRLESTIRTHVKHMFAKHRLRRQADLVRLVRSLAGVPKSRR